MLIYINIKKILVKILFCLGIIYLLLLGSYGYIKITEKNTKLQENIGNFQNNIIDIEAKGKDKESFSFAIIGDSRHGYQIFENIVEKAKSLNPDIIIHLGDFVDKAKKCHYDFFTAELKELNVKQPMFFVNGNHDIYVNSAHDMNKESFAHYFGPTEYFFEYGNSVFITLDNGELHNLNEGQLLWLKNILEKYKIKKHKFIFMHKPPIKLDVSDDKKKYQGTSEYDFDDKGFLDTIRGYNVDYVISSHYHGYKRDVRDGVKHLVTGGAGAPLRQIDAKYHFLLFKVDNGKIEEYIFYFPKEKSFEDQFEMFIHTRIYEFVEDNKILNLIISLIFIFCYAGLILRRIKK